MKFIASSFFNSSQILVLPYRANSWMLKLDSEILVQPIDPSGRRCRFAWYSKNDSRTAAQWSPQIAV